MAQKKKYYIFTIVFFLFTTLVLILCSDICFARRGLQGCCSHHGGVGYCDSSTGMIVCRDGTYSPTCGCPSYKNDSTNNYKNDNRTYSNPYGNYNDTNFSSPKSPLDNSTNNKSYNFTSVKKENEYKKSTLFLFDVLCGYEEYFLYVDTEPHYNAYSEIKIEVDPIDLVFVQINASIPLLFFRSVYKYKITERGGFVKSEKDGSVRYLTEDPKLQYILNIAAGIFGLELEYTSEHFNFGEMRYYESAFGYGDDRNVFLGNNYFEIHKTQIDFRWHLNWFNIARLGGFSSDQSSWDFFIGYRYLDYEMPGIIYIADEYEGPPCGESLPQMVRYRIHMGGLGINNNFKKTSNGLSLLFGGELYLGAGSIKVNLNDYRFNSSVYGTSYDPLTDRKRTLYVYMLGLGGNFGIVWNIINSWLVTSFRVEYLFNLYVKSMSRDLSFDDTTDGFYYETAEVPVDVFHSVRCSVQMTF